jgi:hypothetical protein
MEEKYVLSKKKRYSQEVKDLSVSESLSTLVAGLTGQFYSAHPYLLQVYL